MGQFYDKTSKTATAECVTHRYTFLGIVYFVLHTLQARKSVLL